MTYLCHWLLVLLTAALTGCGTPPPQSSVEPTPAEEPPAAPPAAPVPAATAPSPYPEAIKRASTAYDLSQSAQSNDDWRLVASRWQQAIALLEQVPETDPNYAAAAEKLAGYRQSFINAQVQADTPIPEVTPERVVRLSPNGNPDGESDDDAARELATAATPSPANSTGDLSPDAASSPSSSGAVRTFEAPIIRRAGGTPVIMATFNGNQTFEMIVDTGASGTVITQAMARTLEVEPVGEAEVATASASRVPFQLGYVDALEIAGVRTEEVLVAIAGPELAVGLLGQDFFSGYDVTIRQNVVEFQER